jgi:hypothetical protein
MFDFLKNRAINIVTDELDGCFSFLLESKKTSAKEVDQILNTIRHFIQEIIDRNLTEEQTQKHFMQMKTNIAMKKNLSNHRDTDYAKVYILNAFFTCVASNRLSQSKKVGERILDYCVQNCSLEVRPIGGSLRNDLMKIFA